MIHPTAVIDPKAEIAPDVVVGPFAIIEAGARVGPGCEIAGHAQLLNSITIGENCQIGPAAILGGDPQDTGFDRATPSSVEIGTNTVIREQVTIHRGSKAGNVTRIGTSNFFMANSHVGHDCQVGDHNIFANGALLGGWIEVGDRIFMGGGAAAHQFVRIGDFCMIKGLTALSADLPPYTLCAGSNDVRGLNSIGMRRAGFKAAARADIKKAFKMFYRGGHNFSQAVESASSCSWTTEAERFWEFVRKPGKKGICPSRGGRD
ncbi:MAG: UDP-N-acetylglucosamine acyltransferase [Verrucomicrobiales bacterium]|jgi:UDP-N-acetylglucosamine acyltransferase